MLCLVHSAVIRSTCIQQSYHFISHLTDIPNYLYTFVNYLRPVIILYIQNVLNVSCSNYMDSACSQQVLGSLVLQGCPIGLVDGHFESQWSDGQACCWQMAIYNKVFWQLNLWWLFASCPWMPLDGTDLARSFCLSSQKGSWRYLCMLAIATVLILHWPRRQDLTWHIS